MAKGLIGSSLDIKPNGQNPYRLHSRDHELVVYNEEGAASLLSLNAPLSCLPSVNTHHLPVCCIQYTPYYVLVRLRLMLDFIVAFETNEWHGQVIIATMPTKKQGNKTYIEKKIAILLYRDNALNGFCRRSFLLNRLILLYIFFLLFCFSLL